MCADRRMAQLLHRPETLNPSRLLWVPGERGFVEAHALGCSWLVVSLWPQLQAPRVQCFLGGGWCWEKRIRGFCENPEW